MKRIPISKRISKTLLFVSSLIAVVMSIVILCFLIILRFRTEHTVISQMEENVSRIVKSKVDAAERDLKKYMSYVESNAGYLNLIYKNPDNYVYRHIGQINTDIGDEYSIQRTISNRSIDKEAIDEEMGKLSNIESLWDPLMRSEEDTIKIIYFGSEKGYMLSYDKLARLAEGDKSEDGEIYFEHRQRPWYVTAKNWGKTVLGELGKDSFGRGLTFTCSSPFYDERGVFAGVVGLDILVSDLQEAIIDIDIDSSSMEDYAFLVNKNGDIVASPFIDKNSEDFENINDETNIYHPIREKILSGGTGIELVNDTYCAYAPIEVANWTLCVNIPSALVLKSLHTLDVAILRMVVIFIIILIIIAFTSLWLSQRLANIITAPVLKLRNDVKVISGGDLDRKAEVVGNDEISDLANSFNDMTTSLKTYISDLTSLTAEKERIGAELDVATHIQSSMLPSIFPAFDDQKEFDIYATMNPAKEVGGDFYDFFKIDDKHLVIVVADVSGKGVPAALFMVIGKTLIKDHTTINTDLSEVFQKVNNLLCESNSENLFITAFEAVINLETGHMVYVNAGHEMPYIYRKGKEWTAEQIKPGFVLAGMENMKFKTGELYLNKGDKVFQYTDGVTEATNAKNELYGMDRLKAALDKNSDKSMLELLPAIKADIDEFVGEAPQFDDITMLGFELKG